MRTLLICVFSAVALVGHAQHGTTLAVPPKAVAQLENLRRQTEAEVARKPKTGPIPAEARPALNQLLLKSATDFLLITARKPTKEAYFQSLDGSLAQLMPLTPEVTDRQQVAEYYQDLLDIVGLESSEGRLDAFVKGTPKQ